MAHKQQKINRTNPHLGLLSRPWADPNPDKMLGFPALAGSFRMLIEATRLLFSYHEPDTSWYFSPGAGTGQLGQWFYLGCEPGDISCPVPMTVWAGRPTERQRTDVTFAAVLGDMWLTEGVTEPQGPLVAPLAERLAPMWLPEPPDTGFVPEMLPEPLRGCPVAFCDDEGPLLLPGIHLPYEYEAQRYYRRMTQLEQWFPWYAPHGKSVPPAARSRRLAALSACPQP